MLSKSLQILFRSFPNIFSYKSYSAVNLGIWTFSRSAPAATAAPPRHCWFSCCWLIWFCLPTKLKKRSFVSRAVTCLCFLNNMLQVWSGQPWFHTFQPHFSSAFCGLPLYRPKLSRVQNPTLTANRLNGLWRLGALPALSFGRCHS